MAFDPWGYLERQKELFTPITRKSSKLQKALEKIQGLLGEYEAIGKLRELWEDMTAAMYFNPMEAHKTLKTQLEPLATKLAEEAKDKDVKKIANSFKDVIKAYISEMKEVANYIIKRGRALIYQQEKKIREASQRISEEEARISELLGYSFD